MQTHTRIAVVRAIPNPGHKRRWCGLEKWVADKKVRPNPDEKHGLPWPDTEIKVAIVDEPKPFDPSANGGVPVEISPATLTMLEKDERIAVRVLGGAEGGDPAEAVHLKAELAALTAALEKAQRELADHVERSKASHAVSQRQIEETAAKLAAVEHELATARAQLSARKK
jgi:hypothetical protein